MRPVNLLPAERRKAERQGPKFTPLHGAVVGILVGGLAMGYMGHTVRGKIDVETTKIADLDQQTTTLTAQVEKAKSESKVVVSSYETDKALVTGLAVGRVNWSTVMINLSRVAPGGVWLKSMSVTTPTSADAAAASTPGAVAAKRPAAIKLDASATTRTEAALFLSRLNGIPGFVEPRLVGGINPEGGDATSGSTTPSSFTFSVEIPVDDAIFGPGARPAAPAPAAAPSTTTQTTQP
jgi:Tfp pilus assembly protein PilN